MIRRSVDLAQRSKGVRRGNGPGVSGNDIPAAELLHGRIASVRARRSVSIALITLSTRIAPTGVPPSSVTTTGSNREVLGRNRIRLATSSRVSWGWTRNEIGVLECVSPSGSHQAIG